MSYLSLFLLSLLVISSSVTAASCPGGYRTDTWNPKNDFFKQFYSTTTDYCCSNCSANSQCKGWEFYYAENRCQMFDYMPSFQSHSGYNSGLPSRSGCPGGSLTDYWNPKNDFFKQFYSTSSELCCSNCTANSQCLGWEFYYAENRCQMFSYAPSLQPHSGYNSGLTSNRTSCPGTQTNYWNPRNDYFLQFNSITSDLCCSNCSVYSQCKGWEFYLSDNRCQLFNYTPSLEPRTGYFAGLSSNSTSCPGTQNGYWNPRSDYFQQFYGTTSDLCCSNCSAYSQCKGWEFFYAENRCQLFSYAPSLQSKSGYNAGLPSNITSCPGTQTDYWNPRSDYFQQFYGTTSDLCCSNCSANSQCRGWEFLVSDNRCQLFSYAPSFQSKSGYNAGYSSNKTACPGTQTETWNPRSDYFKQFYQTTSDYCCSNCSVYSQCKGWEFYFSDNRCQMFNYTPSFQAHSGYNAGYSSKSTTTGHPGNKNSRAFVKDKTKIEKSSKDSHTRIRSDKDSHIRSDKDSQILSDKDSQIMDTLKRQYPISSKDANQKIKDSN